MKVEEIIEAAKRIIDLEIYLAEKYRRDASCEAKAQWIINGLREYGLTIVEVEPGSYEKATFEQMNYFARE